jgi:hypothetical protein
MKGTAAIEMMWSDGAGDTAEARASLKNHDAKIISEGRSNFPGVFGYLAAAGLRFHVNEVFQRSCQTGLRFSAKARAPSSPSSVSAISWSRWRA